MALPNEKNWSTGAETIQAGGEVGRDHQRGEETNLADIAFAFVQPTRPPPLPLKLLVLEDETGRLRCVLNTINFMKSMITHFHSHASRCEHVNARFK